MRRKFDFVDYKQSVFDIFKWAEFEDFLNCWESQTQWSLAFSPNGVNKKNIKWALALRMETLS